MPPSNQPHFGVSTADSDASQSSAASAPRRKVFFPLDSLNVGGTETQPVELAVGLDAVRYAVNLGNRGREYVISEFNFQRMTENTGQLYTGLLGQRGIE